MTDHIVDANKLVRAEFEAWAHKTHYNLGVGPNGLYQSGRTSSAWASWQAATQRQQERIAELEADIAHKDAYAEQLGRLLFKAGAERQELEAQVQALSLDAAAPDLLAVVIHARNVLPNEHWADDTRRMLDAAIARATHKEQT